MKENLILKRYMLDMIVRTLRILKALYFENVRNVSFAMYLIGIILTRELSELFFVDFDQL